MNFYSEFSGLIIARRNGDNWYIGGMTDWVERDIEINLSFLPKEKNII